MSPIKPGRYTAKIQDYSIGETLSGYPQLLITFIFQTAGEEHTLNWYGNFKEGRAREITMESLIKCGMTQSDLSLLADGPSSQALDMERELDIDVIREMANGRSRMRIKWIHTASKGPVRKKFSRESFQTYILETGLEDCFHKIKQRINDPTIDPTMPSNGFCRE